MLTAAGLDNFKLLSMSERIMYMTDYIMCHKVCKSIFTHKRSGQIVECKRSKMSAISVKVPDFKSCCFICGKDRVVKGIRDMCSVSSKSRSDAIRGRASELKDAYVLDNITN